MLALALAPALTAVLVPAAVPAPAMAVLAADGVEFKNPETIQAGIDIPAFFNPMSCGTGATRV